MDADEAGHCFLYLDSNFAITIHAGYLGTFQKYRLRVSWWLHCPCSVCTVDMAGLDHGSHAIQWWKAHKTTAGNSQWGWTTQVAMMHRQSGSSLQTQAGYKTIFPQLNGWHDGVIWHFAITAPCCVFAILLMPCEKVKMVCPSLWRECTCICWFHSSKCTRRSL